MKNAKQFAVLSILFLGVFIFGSSTYTVDEVEDIKLMLACGVDGIFTNDPERTKHFLAQLNEL